VEVGAQLRHQLLLRWIGAAFGSPKELFLQKVSKQAMGFAAPCSLCTGSLGNPRMSAPSFLQLQASVCCATWCLLITDFNLA
jgi:hypothetical protein